LLPAICIVLAEVPRSFSASQVMFWRSFPTTKDNQNVTKEDEISSAVPAC
jgi:hypothetical protein